MKMHVLFTLAAILLAASPLSATVDLLYVNHVTKQLAVMDEDRYTGLFWHCAGGEERHFTEAEKRYLPLGYRYTSSPVIIEKIAVLVIFLLASCYAVVKFLILIRRKFNRD